MAFMSVLLAISIFVLLPIVGFLSFSVYVFYRHWRYQHIPGPTRDGFFSGNIPFIQNETRRVPGSGRLIFISSPFETSIGQGVDLEFNFRNEFKVY